MTSQGMLDTAGEFVEARLLHASVEVGLFDMTPANTKTLARRLAVRPERLEPFLLALSGLDLLEKVGNEWRCGVAAERHLRNGCPDDLRAYVRRLSRSYLEWSDLTAILEARSPLEFQHEYLRHTAAHAEFARAMAEESGDTPQAVAELPCWAGRRRIVDLGGGHGRYAAAILDRYTLPEAVVVDVAEVSGIASRYLAPYGARARFLVADIQAPDEWEASDGDAVLLTNVLSDVGPDGSGAVLRDAARKVGEEGTVVVVGPRHTRKEAEAGLFSLHMAVGCFLGWAVPREFVDESVPKGIAVEYPLPDDQVAWVCQGGVRS